VIIDETWGEARIDPSAIIEKTAVIHGPCVICANTYIGHYVVIGSPGQHAAYAPAPVASMDVATRGVRIETGAVIREHSQVQQGIKRETLVGRDSHIMAMTHVSHDTLIGDSVTVSTNTVFGGHSIVLDYATLGQCVVTHPWVVIGHGAMVGQGSCVIREVPPEAKVAGVPAKIIGHNTGPGGEKQEYDSSLVDDYWMTVYLQRVLENNKERVGS
jgi:UDP-N-acetylglucosamine acyltransferase